MNRDHAVEYLRNESEKFKGKPISNYFGDLANELSSVPAILVGERSGKLLEEIKWTDHAKASGYFRTDSVGVRLPFPSCWIEIETGNGLRGSLLRQLRENIIIGIALKKDPDQKGKWRIYNCEFLITVGTISGRVQEAIERLYPGRLEVEHILGIYRMESIIPLPLNPESSIEEIQSNLYDESCLSSEGSELLVLATTHILQNKPYEVSVQRLQLPGEQPGYRDQES